MGPDIDMKFHQEVMEIVSYDNITNNGTEFVNKISKELYTRCNVAHCIKSPYHPAVNGL